MRVIYSALLSIAMLLAYLPLAIIGAAAIVVTGLIQLAGVGPASLANLCNAGCTAIQRYAHRAATRAEVKP